MALTINQEKQIRKDRARTGLATINATRLLNLESLAKTTAQYRRAQKLESSSEVIAFRKQTLTEIDDLLELLGVMARE